ncbi:MAG TPA: SDR family oxidoreductase [Solirubrobacteraceae bacterium]|nr:SDR family oxidoreductase [Solirubrobacteraceae bacterium]
MSRFVPGQRALIAGGGRGIGRGVALALAAAGVEVTATARTRADLDALGAEAAGLPGSVSGVVADVRDERAMGEAVRGSEPDLLVCAAGINRPGPLLDTPLDDVREILEINVTGAFVACRAFARAALAAGRSGAIVTLSSQMGSVGYPGRAPYCASKHAVDGLTRALALEWAPHGIRVNAVAPTFVRTPFTAPMFAVPGFEREVLSRIPLGRIAEVADVTGAVLFLLSEEAALVTGHVLAVDGGWTAQ